jgi:hypothetical protein
MILLKGNNLLESQLMQLGGAAGWEGLDAVGT